MGAMGDLAGSSRPQLYLPPLKPGLDPTCSVMLSEHFLPIKLLLHLSSEENICTILQMLHLQELSSSRAHSPILAQDFIFISLGFLRALSMCCAQQLPNTLASPFTLQRQPDGYPLARDLFAPCWH